MKFRNPALVCSLLIASSTALAQTPPPSYYDRPAGPATATAEPLIKPAPQDSKKSYGYGGVALGASRMSTDYSFTPGVGFHGDDNSNEFAWKFYGGYRFNSWFGLEGGGVMLGKSDSTYTSSAIPGFSGDVEYSSRGAYVAAVLALPVTKDLSVYGKAGPLLSWIRTDTTYTGLYGTSGSSDTSDTNVSLMWGIGVDWYWSESFGMRVEYENYGNIYKNSGTEVEAQAVFAGLNLRF